MLAAGDGIAGLEAEVGPKPTGDGFALHGDGEAITDARDGEDGGLIFVADGAPEFGDGGGQRAVHDDRARPHGFEKLVFGHDFAGVLQELKEDFEGLGFELDRDVADAQFAPEFVQFAVAEPPTPGGNVATGRAVVFRRHRVSVL